MRRGLILAALLSSFGVLGTNVVSRAENPFSPSPVPVHFYQANPLAPDDNPLAPGNPPAQNAFPAFLKAGTRIAYHSGDSIVPNTSLPLQPDGKGNWFDTKGNAHVPGSGGVGITTLDIVDVTANTLAADVRNYLNVDLNNNIYSMISSTGVLGSTNGLGDFWVPPDRLRAMQPGNVNGVLITRADYPLNGRTFDTLSITTYDQRGYSRFVYDIDTGLMIVSSTSRVVENRNLISHAQLIEVRDRALPWSGDPLPDWMGPNHRLDYQGVFNNIMPGIESPSRYALTFAFGERHGNAVRASQMTSLDAGNGMPPSQGQVDRVFGGGGLGPVYISPQTLARLRPGQVLDEDGPTRSRVTFVGIQNNLAFIADQRGSETYQFGYDVPSGTLSMIYMEKKQGAGMIRVQLQLTNRQ